MKSRLVVILVKLEKGGVQDVRAQVNQERMKNGNKLRRSEPNETRFKIRVRQIKFIWYTNEAWSREREQDGPNKKRVDNDRVRVGSSLLSVKGRGLSG